AGRETWIPQEGRTRPSHRLSARAYRSARRHSLRRRPLAPPGSFVGPDPQGPADHPSSRTDSPRLPGARHITRTDHPGTLCDREEVPSDLYEPAFQSPGRADV